MHTKWLRDQSVNLVPRRIYSLTTKSDGDAPLILTPLLKVGKITEARCYSEVHDLVLNLRSNAGFLTVNETYNSNLYFWFFPKNGVDWENAPVVLWLQGGPGCSSLFGLFTENGPLIATSSGFKQRLKYSWTTHYNMLYIDQPVGTGFSFTDYEEGYLKTQEQVGEHLYEALLQFFQLYPELKNNKFYLSGESYAGKYIPAVAHVIHKKNPSSKIFINLQGLIIGNGFSDPENMMQYSKYVHRLGLIDEQTKRKLETKERKIRVLIHSKQWEAAFLAWNDLLYNLSMAMHFLALYDYTKETFTGDDKYVSLITKDHIRKLIHVGQRKYEDCSDRVWIDFQQDFMQSMKPMIEELLEHYPIMFYSGQLDIIVAYPLSENFFQKLQWNGAEQYYNAKRNILKVGKHVAGYYKSAGNLTDVLLLNAGHMAPFNQPKHVLDMLHKFIENVFLSH